MVLANARMSERSWRKAQRFAGLARSTFGGLQAVWAQPHDDAQRLRSLGAPVSAVMGNLKFDAVPDEALLAVGHRWRSALASRPVVLLAISREGEEAQFVEVLQQHPEYLTQVQWWIVPRHPQRFDEAASLLEAARVKYVRWSTIRHNVDAPHELAHVEVVLCDTLGEMPFFYAASDVAIVAGSFAPHGGQNLIEACALGTPVIVGPFTRNFADAVDGAVAVGAAIQIVSSELVDPAQRAVATAVSWLQEPEALANRGRLGRDWVAQHTGATQRIVQQINEFEAARDRSSRHPR
jgi:3-deoxy-D-manno-octulosonic-acid transferase